MRKIVPILTLLSCGVITPAAAQQAEGIDDNGTVSETASASPRPAAPRRWSVSMGTTLVSQYISRGVGFGERPSLQPFISLHADLPELTGGALTDLSWFVGNWNSLQNGSPGLGQPSRGRLAEWYEADLYTGLAAGLGERWRASLAYYHYLSPGHSFDAYGDVELIISFDDAGYWGETVPLRDFTLSPALRVTQEVGRPRREDALYVQPSLTPSFNFGDPDRPISLLIPLVLGFSDDYYDRVGGGKVSFGYFRTGVTVAGKPFPRGPARALTVNGGFDLWMLNDKVANGLKDNEIVGRVGVSWSF